MIFHINRLTLKPSLTDEQRREALDLVRQAGAANMRSLRQWFRRSSSRTIGLPDAASPPMCNKSGTITADVEIPDSNANGMIVTHGGLEGGYGLYLRDGKPTFVYNFLSVERTTFAAKGSVAGRKGHHRG